MTPRFLMFAASLAVPMLAFGFICAAAGQQSKREALAEKFHKDAVELHMLNHHSSKADAERIVTKNERLRIAEQKVAAEQYRKHLIKLRELAAMNFTPEEEAIWKRVQASKDAKLELWMAQWDGVEAWDIVNRDCQTGEKVP